MSEIDVLDVEDTVLCIDISRSMARKYCAEMSRLNVVKNVLIDFVKAKLKIDKRDRFAIVGFSTNAQVILKLTNDEEEIINSINSLTPRGVSGLGEGIAVSLNILSHEILQEGQNVNRILILSDGKPWIGTIDPIEKAEMAAQLGIIVDCIEISKSQEDWGENILESMAKLGTFHQAINIDLLRLPLQTLTHKKDVYEMKKEMPKLSLIATPLINPKELMPEIKESIDFFLGDVEPNCIICRMSDCGICKKELDCFRICPYCKNYMHLCCVEKWSESSKMIEAQVFRCPHCLMLLRLPDSVKKPKIDLPPPIEEPKEDEDKVIITPALSGSSSSKPKPSMPSKAQKPQLPSSLNAKIGDFIREGGRVLLKEIIKGEEKFLYLAWDNWGARNFTCDLMSGIDDKICKEFRPIIDWEKGICTGFTIIDTLGWLSNLSYEYGILILNLEGLIQWCTNVLSDLKSIKNLINNHPEIEFTSDKLTDFELKATVKFDAPIEIANRDELTGNLLIGVVTYLHLWHNVLSQQIIKKIEKRKASSEVARSITIPEPSSKKIEQEFKIDFDQMDESIETETQNKKILEPEKDAADEIIYRYHCKDCNKWFKSKETKQINCPSCSKPLKLGLYCKDCNKWYFVNKFQKYKCAQCGNMLQIND